MIKLLALLLLLPPTESAADNPVIAKMHETAIKHRKEYGLKPQALDKECCQIAQKWADHLAENNYFYHGGGEQIIAMGYATPESAFRGWLGSSGHRYWVLSNTDKCGWGAAKSSNGTWYWVGVFRDNEPKPTVYLQQRRRLFRR